MAKNGIKLRQSVFTNDEGERIAFVNVSVRINDKSVNVTPVKFDKRVFNMIVESMGFVVGRISADDVIDMKVVEIGE